MLRRVANVVQRSNSLHFNTTRTTIDAISVPACVRASFLSTNSSQEQSATHVKKTGKSKRKKLSRKKKFHKTHNPVPTPIAAAVEANAEKNEDDKDSSPTTTEEHWSENTDQSTTEAVVVEYKEEINEEEEMNKSSNDRNEQPIDVDDNELQDISQIESGTKEEELSTVLDTLSTIAKLQEKLPSMDQMISIIDQAPKSSPNNTFNAYSLYLQCKNADIDETFLIPAILSSCEAKEPARALEMVGDLIAKDRKVPKQVFRAILDACDDCGVSEEAFRAIELMKKSDIQPDVPDYHTVLSACLRNENLDRSLIALRELRILNGAYPVTFLKCLTMAKRLWRADIFVDTLIEMRLAGLEPEIPSLTSLEPGRRDLALTVMEGVRAVGLDPHYAMAAILSSIHISQRPRINDKYDKPGTNTNDFFDGLSPVELSWKTAPIPQLLETQAAGLLLKQESFSRLRYNRVYEIEQYLRFLPIDANLTVNLKKQLQRMSLLINTTRVRNNKSTILEEYENGESLIELSKRHNYPPVSLMRIILQARGMKQNKIKDALNSPESKLDTRDHSEFMKASYQDSIHKGDPIVSKEQRAADLETIVSYYLQSKGIRFRTEEELVVEQREKYGRKVLSPDFLLLDPLIINGYPVRWIDAKDYYGAHLVDKFRMRKQLNAYIKEWGPGAVVFGMGFSDMFSIPGVLCLDTTQIPTSGIQFRKMKLKAGAYSIFNRMNWSPTLRGEILSPQDRNKSDSKTTANDSYRASKE